MNGGGTLGAGAEGTTGGAPQPWLIVMPGILGIVSSVLLIVVDAGGLIMGSWGPQPGLGWLKSDLAANAVLFLVAVAALFVGLSTPGIRRTAIIVAWLVIPVGWALFLMARHLIRNAA
jgi:hypothetical protein